MTVSPNQNQTITVEISIDELKLIHGLTQNCNPDESDELKQTYLSLFVGSGRALGKNFTDDGKFIPDRETNEFYKYGG